MLDGEFHFLIDDYSERRRWRRRGRSFLFSVLFHLLLILSILFGPLLLAPSRKLSPEFMERELTRLDTSRPSFLPMPEDRQKPKKPLESPTLSDKDRIAQGKVPMIDPRGEKAPFQEGDAKLLEQAARQGEPPAPSPPPPPSQQAGNRVVPQDGLAKDQTGSESKMSLPGSAQAGSPQPGKSLRDLMAQMETPGSSVRQSLEDALNKGLIGSGGKGSGGGTSMRQFDNRRADFSVEEPTILTDTQGADFGPWLRIVYFRVRDNWYSAIPELIRSGARGKAVLIFDVKKDGRVYNLQVAKTSGLHPYDRAAISSIKLSEPFPNFPPTFAGDQITIQFSYFYNIRL